MTICHRSSLRPVLMASLLVASLLAGLFSLPLVADACPVIYTGRATAVNAKLTVLGATTQVVEADKGLSCNGKPVEEVVSTVQNPSPLILQANTLYAATQGIDWIAMTESGAENVLVNIPGVKITGAVVQSQAEAECMEDGTIRVAGNSTLTNVRLNNTPINISGQPNQRIGIPGVATVVFNQQIPKSTQIEVNGIRVTLAGATGQVASGDVRVAHARAGISSCNR